MRPTIRFTDTVLSEIAAVLASVPPERGGALVAAGDIVHHLVEDTHGGYTGVSWDISAELTGAVQAAEAAARGTLAGTVHTHPRGTPDPSDQDLRSTAHLLDANPHLDQVVVCIVTEGDARAHDLPIGTHHRMSVHLARRGPQGSMRCGRIDAQVVPTCGLSDLVHDLDGRVLRWNGIDRLALPSVADEGVAVLFHADHPTAPPVAVRLTDDGALQPAPVDGWSWNPTTDAAGQIRDLLATATVARADGFLDRIEGLAGDLAQRHVLVAGVGSVGSWMVEELVRAGVGRLTLLDDDTVDAANLCRTTFEHRHIGTSKVHAVADLARRINPAVAVDPIERQLGDPDVDLAALARTSDLVIAATDDPVGQGLLSHHAYAAGVPLVSCALYKRAAAGEVVIVLRQADTACWRCAIGDHTTHQRPDRDDGTGRLSAELALGPPIHLVAEVASGVAIGLLAGPDTPSGEAVTDLLVSRRTLGLVATAPRWDFFPDVFAGLEGHQWAPQSLWARVERRADCPVCGDHPSGPATRPEGEAVAARIRALRAELELLPDDDQAAADPSCDDHSDPLESRRA